MEQGRLEGWEALALIVSPPAGSRLERPPPPVSGQRPWAGEVRAEAIRLVEDGLSKPEVAERLAVSEGTVRLWWREHRQSAERANGRAA
jgi:transposase-like protein